MTAGVLFAAIAIGLAVGLITAWIAAKVRTRAIRQIAHHAHGTAHSGLIRLAVGGDDAIGALGQSVRQMAERAAAELEDQRALLESVLDGINQGVVVLDRERRIRLINKAARSILELEDAQLGEVFIDHVRIPTLVEMLSGGPARSAELLSPRGAKLIARADALSSGAGRIVMLEDVTAVRRLETIRRDFVANVSHELRTPVSIIRANAETLIGGAKDDPAFSAKLIDGLHRNAERLARILADLLDLSRLEAGQYRIELAPVTVRAAVEQVVAMLDNAAAERKVELQIDVPEGTSVRADSKALDQVLVNLVDNALKYTPAGGHVAIEATPRGTAIRIAIRDDGPGIPPHHRQRIFERFYRVDPGRSREMGGTGLGLSIVKHLVESMNGTIGVDANQPNGSIFWVELPGA